MLVRCTARLRKLLGAVPLADDPPSPDDWYANLAWISGRKCLLLVHAGTLYPVFVADVRKADLTPFGMAVATFAVDALAGDGYPADTLGTLDPTRVRIGPTADRRVVGVMVDMIKMTEYVVEREGGLAHLDIEAHNAFLRRTPYGRRDHGRPRDAVAARHEARG